MPHHLGSGPAIPSSAKVTLSPRVVRPPKTEEASRWSLNKSSDHGPTRAPTRPFRAPALSTAPVGDVPEEARTSPRVAASDTIFSAKSDNYSRVFVKSMEECAHSVKSATRDVVVADIAAWPVSGGTSRLLDVLSRLAKTMDAERSPVLRASLVVDMLLQMGEEMRSFRPYFAMLATEVRQLVTLYADATSASEETASRIKALDTMWKAELQEQEVRMSHEIRTLTQELEDHRARSRRIECDAERVRQLQSELDRDKKIFQIKENEVVQAKKIQEQMSLQFAQRNKVLQDAVPPLEEEARAQRQRAEDLQQVNQRLAQRLAVQEKSHAKITRDLERRLAEEKESAEEQLNHNRRLASSLHALRVVKEQLCEELEQSKREASAVKSKFEESMRCMTPRPQYADDEDESSGAKKTAKLRTSERYASLLQQLHQARENIALYEREVVVLRDVALLASSADSVGQPSPILQTPNSEVFLITAAMLSGEAADDVVVPQSPSSSTASDYPPVYMWPPGVQRISCKPCTLQEIVTRARELLEHCTLLQARTFKHVELHVSMLVFFLEGFALGDYTTPFGQYPALSASAGASYRIPMSVYEHCVNIIRSADVWVDEPILRIFACILREEVGPWLWQHQKTVIMELMTELTSVGDALTIANAHTIIDAHLSGDWPVSAVVAAKRALMQCANRVIVSGSLAAAAHRRQSMLKPNPNTAVPLSPTDPSSTRIIIEYDRDAILETLFVRRLRVILLEPVLHFYNGLEQRILESVLGPNAARLTHTTTFDMAHADASTVSEAVMMQCPAVDAHSAQVYANDVLELCSATLKNEASAIRTGSVDYLGPQMGTAASQMYLSGLMQHYCGCARPYPKLMTQRALNNRKQRRKSAAVDARRKSVVSLPSSQPLPTTPGTVQPATVPPGSANRKRGGLFPDNIGEADDARSVSKQTQKGVLPLLVVLRMIRKLPPPLGFSSATSTSLNDF